MKHFINLKKKFTILPLLSAVIILLSLPVSAQPPVFSRGCSHRNLLNLSRTAAYSFPAKIRATPQNPDTVYVVAFRVEFQSDETDFTTGNGTFGSDTTYPDNVYRYDRKDHNKEYFEKHLEFLKNYYYEISDRRLVIEYRIYPDTPLGPYYTVPKKMRRYSPESKKDEESYCAFGSRKADSLMLFIEDAISTADNTTGLPSPFDHPFPEDKTAYLLIHAGASAFADGGYLQALGDIARDTPSDFYDFFVSQRDLRYYLGKDGISVSNGQKKISEMMMVSETGNQDSLNFGINGILVNQFAQQLGVPNLYGVTANCVGISAVGGFCLMDFAGYNNGFGFIPPYPSAWVRAFLGWTAPTYCPTGKDSTYSVFAANLDTTHEILQIPLNENEYLLVENRQRLLEARAGTFSPQRGWIKKLYSGDILIGDSLKIDEIVETDNSRSDIIVSAKNYDVGLPGSGLLVWHIDESILRSYYEYGMVNADSARRGVSVIEADGYQDVGVQYANVFGTVTQDYGQPRDFFPHRVLGENNTSTHINSLTEIYTHDGALVPLQIKSIEPDNEYATDTLYSEGHGEENAKEAVNYISKRFKLSLEWGRKQGIWPQACDSAAKNTHLAAVDLMDSVSGKEIVSISSNGRVYCMGINGEKVGPLRDTLAVLDAKTDPDTLRLIERSFLAVLESNLTTPAVHGDTLVTAGKRNLYYLYNAGNDSIGLDSVQTGITVAAGPVIGDDGVYLAAQNGKIYIVAGGVISDSLNPGFSEEPTAIAVSDLDADNTAEIIAAYSDGSVCVFENGSLKKSSRSLNLTDPRIAVGNIDHSDDDSREIAIVGKNGNTYVVSCSLTYDDKCWPVKIRRNNTSMPALADMDGDGYLDLVISGENRLYALDQRGNNLDNWPVSLSDGEGYGQIQCSPTLADVNGNGKPEAIFGVGFVEFMIDTIDTTSKDPTLTIPDSGYYSSGQVLALTGTGGMPGYQDSKKNFKSLWPFSTATPVVSSMLITDADEDGTLEMIGVSSGGWVYAWNLDSTSGKSAKVYWNGGAADLQRTSAYPEALMPSAPAASSEPFDIAFMYTYPNPARQKNQITLRYRLTHSADRASVKLYNSAGDPVGFHESLTTSASWNRYALDVSRLPSGVYRAKLVVHRNGERKVRFCKFALIK